MLRTLIPLERTSGGVIPTGAIITYKIETFPTSNKVGIKYFVYYNTDALANKKPSCTQDILLFRKDNDQKNGGEGVIDDSVLNELNPLSLINITDTIALNFIETNFLGEGSCEKIGDSFE